MQKPFILTIVIFVLQMSKEEFTSKKKYNFFVFWLWKNYCCQVPHYSCVTLNSLFARLTLSRLFSWFAITVKNDLTNSIFNRLLRRWLAFLQHCQGPQSLLKKFLKLFSFFYKLNLNLYTLFWFSTLLGYVLPYIHSNFQAGWSYFQPHLTPHFQTRLLTYL